MPPYPEVSSEVPAIRGFRAVFERTPVAGCCQPIVKFQVLCGVAQPGMSQVGDSGATRGGGASLVRAVP